jgi:hypothetical protein
MGDSHVVLTPFYGLVLELSAHAEETVALGAGSVQLVSQFFVLSLEVYKPLTACFYLY